MSDMLARLLARAGVAAPPPDAPQLLRPQIAARFEPRPFEGDATPTNPMAVADRSQTAAPASTRAPDRPAPPRDATVPSRAPDADSPSASRPPAPKPLPSQADSLRPAEAAAQPILAARPATPTPRWLPSEETARSTLSSPAAQNPEPNAALIRTTAAAAAIPAPQSDTREPSSPPTPKPFLPTVSEPAPAPRRRSDPVAPPAVAERAAIEAPQPGVVIEIGRVEIIAARPEVRRPAPSPARPAGLGLADFLKRRRGE